MAVALETTQILLFVETLVSGIARLASSANLKAEPDAQDGGTEHLDALASKMEGIHIDEVIDAGVNLPTSNMVPRYV